MNPMMDCGGMMWGMGIMGMWGIDVIGVLAIVALVLLIAALTKYLFFSRPKQ